MWPPKWKAGRKLNSIHIPLQLTKLNMESSGTINSKCRPANVLMDTSTCVCCALRGNGDYFWEYNAKSNAINIVKGLVQGNNADVCLIDTLTQSKFSNSSSS